tara:strand:- start:412 stop:1032 length:621 start_codon:yes stop_codon:yes gene_type:complete
MPKKKNIKKKKKIVKKISPKSAFAKRRSLSKKPLVKRKALSKKPVRRGAKKVNKATLRKKTSVIKGSKRRPRLQKDYKPTKSEAFMNPMQVEYFRQKLHKWRKAVLQESSETLKHLKEETSGIADPSDRATIETEHALELRTRDRQRKLLLKIDQALERIDSGIYGFCEVMGTPISLFRLEARPIATMSIEAQELHEKKEKVQNND